MKFARTVLLFSSLLSFTAWAAPPDLDEPLISFIEPTEGLTGQHVFILGHNLGSAPLVEFNGTAAPIILYRPDLGQLVASVPAAATSGPLIVTDTGTGIASNSAGFDVLPGSYASACTISGTVTGPDTMPLANVPVAASDAASNRLVRFDVTDAAGHYVLDLPSAGDWVVAFHAPVGTPYLRYSGESPCSGVMDHVFTAGPELRGTVRSEELPNDPIRNSRVLVLGPSGTTFQVLSDANGEFSIHLVAGLYDFYALGPAGSRFITHGRFGIDVSSDTDLGNVDLATGWLLSGQVGFQDSSGTGALMNGALVLYQEEDLKGIAQTIVDGRYWLATSQCTGCTLEVFAGRIGLVPLEVRLVDVTSDTELEGAFTVYSPDAHGPTLPTIIETGHHALREGQPTYFRGLNLGGSSVSVRFPDGGGGWVEGDDTWVDPVRNLIVTRAPNGAVSGHVHIRVDGVDGPGYPLTIVPGIHLPGSYTISGTITDGSNELEGIPVVLVHIDHCDDDFVIDYDVTDTSGAYSVNHAGGNHIVYPFPPVSSGLTANWAFLADLTGSTVRDLILDVGTALTGRVVDSGIGPVGATLAPIPNSLIDVEAHDIWAEEWVQSDGSGLFTMSLLTSSYDVFVEGPSESRYLSLGLDVPGPTDLGDIPLDSGYFIEGFVVDDTGAGVAGLEVSARDTSSGDYVGSGAMTVEDTGRFRMAVYQGVYEIGFWVPPSLDYVVEPVTDVAVSSDVRLYPAIEARTAAHIRGTVYLADGVTPVPDVTVSSHDPVTWNITGSERTCLDGSYDLKVAPGECVMQAWPGADYPCLSREFHSETYYLCDAEPVTAGLPDPTTGIDFTLDPAGSISGRVVDDFGTGIPDARICVDGGPGVSTCWIHCVSTSGDGTYRLENAPAGSGNRVRMTHPSRPTECWSGHTNCTDYNPVSVAACTETGSINFGPSTGLPGAVPDGTYVPGAPVTASYDRGTGMVTVNWQPTCDADGHALYVGSLGAFGTYTEATCSIGTTGTYEFPAPAGNVFFVVVGYNGPTEGSYGRKGDGFERPSAAGQHCGYTQDLGSTCVP